MFYRILSLIVLTLLSTSLKAQSSASKSTAKQNSVAELDRQRLLEQAYETAKSVWASSRNISDTRQRTDINLRAFRIVRANEPELAHTELTRNFDDLLDVYSSMSKQDKSRPTIETAIARIISSLAPEDSAAAQKLQQRYFETRRQITADRTDDRRDLADTLNLASDLLDGDVKQSVQLASQVFEKVFPENAIQYLFNLQRREPKTAQQLYQLVLRLLASGQHYSPRAAISISVYAFNEKQLVSPGVWRGDDGKQRVSLFATATSYERSRDTVDIALANAFISASYQYLQKRVLQDTSADRSDPAAIYSNYFLQQKLKACAQLYRLDPESQWVRYETAVTALARQAGANESDLTLLSEQAHKICRQQSANSDSGDDNAFALAAEEKDQRKKAKLLVDGIMWLLRQKRFASAEQNVDSLEDLNMRNQMAQVVKVAIAKDAIERRHWSEVSQRIEKIDDRTMRVYLLLEAGSVKGTSKPDREVALRYVSDARKVLETFDNVVQKAAGVVATLALMQTIDANSTPLALNEVSKVINGAEKYQGENYFALLFLPPNNSEFGYQLKEIGFEDCFARAGKYDWLGTDLAALNLENKYLQALARLTAAKALLEKN